MDRDLEDHTSGSRDDFEYVPLTEGRNITPRISGWSHDVPSDFSSHTTLPQPAPNADFYDMSGNTGAAHDDGAGPYETFRPLSQPRNRNEEMTSNLATHINGLTTAVHGLTERQSNLEQTVQRGFQTMNETYVSSMTEMNEKIGSLQVAQMNTAGPGQMRRKVTRKGKKNRKSMLVPGWKRRGLLPHWTLIPEARNSQDYSDGVKWCITFIVAVAGAAAPIGSAILFPALMDMARELHTTESVGNLSVASYLLAMAIVPLWWSSFSELLGRRTIYLVSFFISVVFNILAGLSVNVGMLIAMRVLSGGATSSVQAVGAGTIADVWEPKHRGRAMGIFFLGPLLGPLVAPLIGGVLTGTFGWRSTMYFCAAYNATIFLLVLLCLPETLASRKRINTPSMQMPVSTAGLSRNPSVRSIQIQTRRTTKFVNRFFIQPLSIVTYLKFPPVAITVFFAAVTFGSLYVLNISIQAAFSAPPYGFNSTIVGLLYIPNSLGYMLSAIIGGKLMDKMMVRKAEKANRYDDDGKLILLPEDRMGINAWIAATLYPGALVWYGWIVQYGMHWAIAAVANLFFGIGSMIVFSTATTMLTEFMPKRSSAGVALNNLVRNLFSVVGTVAAEPLLKALGHGVLLTGMAVIAWISGNVAIWLLRTKGPKWRAAMQAKHKPPQTKPPQ